MDPTHGVLVLSGAHSTDLWVLTWGLIISFAFHDLGVERRREKMLVMLLLGRVRKVVMARKTTISVKRSLSDYGSKHLGHGVVLLDLSRS